VRLGPTLLLCSLAVPAAATHLPVIHLEGEARYKAIGRCFEPNGAVPLEADPGAYRFFKLRTHRVRGTLQAILDYDLDTGRCELQLHEFTGAGTALAFDGFCFDFPSGEPTPLVPVQEPRRRLELLPVILADVYGFGGMNGYVIWPPGGLQRSSPEALGFSAHFTYTKTYVPPSPAAWPSRWRLGGLGPSFDRCVYRGTLRLGPVPVF
jgi:hypothetical protein